MKAIVPLCMLSLFLATTGCQKQDRPVPVPNPHEIPSPANSQTQDAADPATGLTDTVSPAAKADLAEKPADESPAGNESAETDEGVMDSVGRVLGDAADVGLGAASDSAAYVTELYDSLKAKGLTSADNAKQWVSEDFQSMGAWEYKVVTMQDDVETGLNELGKQGWECFHVQSEPGSAIHPVFYLKRQRKSYLRNVPLRDLIRMVPMMSGSQ